MAKKLSESDKPPFQWIKDYNAAKKKYSLKKYKFIDLFAGIGGMRYPAEKTFHSVCVFSSEIDKFSVETYKANFKGKVHGDIKENAKYIPKFDILLGGFPCQPFSNAGLKKGFNDVRGTLFFDICKIIKKHRPKVVLLENVKAYKSNNNGNTFQTTLRILEKELGYKVYYNILNSRDFGIPQNRERLFIICFKNKNKKFEWPLPLHRKKIVKDILEKRVDKKYTISDILWSSHQSRKIRNKEKGKGFGYNIVHPKSEYTNTMSARYYKDGAEILLAQKNKNPRKITPREAARLQGFPDTFKIPVSDNQAYKQFGNTVCIPVIEALLLQIAKAM